jgi:tetratricopeptide (TPR) repeat protein
MRIADAADSLPIAHVTSIVSECDRCRPHGADWNQKAIMKKGENPQLDLAWWKKGKPITLKNGELDAALAKYEKAMEEWDKKQPDENHIARIRSLEEVNGAAKSVIKACNKKLHDETITCLEKFPKLINDKKAALNEQYDQLRTMQQAEFSKILEKMTKTAETTEETFYDIYDDLTKKQSNIQQVGDYGLGGIDALSLLIDELVTGGIQGTPSAHSKTIRMW